MKLLKPLHFDKIWGYEDWIASTHKDGPQPEFVKVAGDFPLLVKIIQADSTLSVQIHPDDKTAARLEGAGNRGKTECWYVLDAKPDAKLVYGFKKDYSIEEIKKAIDDEKIESLLNQVQVKKGDFIFIPSGTVHAIGGGLRLLEVQQSCNITYRFYDWGRGRELHIEKGLKSIKTSAQIKNDLNGSAKMNGDVFDLAKISPFGEKFECKYFSIEKQNVEGEFSFEAQKTEKIELLFVARAEKLSVESSSGEKFDAKSEQIFAVSPGEKIRIAGEGTILRITAEEN